MNKEKIKDILLRIRYHDKWLIDIYTYNELKKKTDIRLDKHLSMKKIKYLGYLKRDTKIEFNHNNYDNIFKCINFLLENNYTNIIIYIKDKLEFNDYILNNNIDSIISDNVKVTVSCNECSIKNYLKYENILYNMIKPAVNLTPLEKFIYAYNITKQYKKYKENNSNKLSARNLYEILDNEYIVCVGFMYLLKDLLHKLNIKSVETSPIIDSSYYGVKINEVDFKEVKIVRKSGHSRLYVYIKDEKYNIDGLYLSDPTWDNDLEYDYYNHMLFTDRKNDYTKPYQWLDKNMLFNVNYINEFNRNFDIVRRKLGYNGIELINFLLDTIKELDGEFVTQLKNKYNMIDSNHCHVYEKRINYKKLLKLKSDLGKYIVSKVNKEIDNSIIKTAIRNVYDKLYGFENVYKLDEYLNDVFNYNEEREKYAFPDRYKIDKNGNKTLIKKIY